ncbi:hypothetical protein MK338_04095, partial [Streptococcus vestibularis]|nr:hypothetical protein [Streptococcus vestibularis]
GFDVTAIT